MLITVQLEDNGPITLIEEILLEKTIGAIDNNVENTDWVEYRFNGKLVHRSAHVRLKKGINLSSEAGSLG